MYNRDPFALRRPSPFEFFRSGTRCAIDSPHSLQAQIKQETQSSRAPEQILKDPEPSSVGGMSYAVNRTVPSEDTTWQPRRIHNTQSSGVSETVGNILASKNELPMYKDKPYNYAASKRKLPIYRRKRVLLLLFATIGCALYWVGVIPDTLHIKDRTRESGNGLFGLISGTKSGTVNWEERRARVRDAFTVSWNAYEKYAWGFDEFHPISREGKQMVPNGMGWIIVDALDTMILMNLTGPLSHAREWISSTLSYDQDHDVNTFETTIRMLGGLLSAHYLSSTFPEMAPVPNVLGSAREDLYLEKATDLADRLLGAYDSNSGIPFASVNLKTRKGIPSHGDAGASSTAEAASLQLEMKYLAKLTGEKQYWDSAEKIMEVIDGNGAKDGLLPIFIFADLGIFSGNTIRLGSRGDSYYEYLIKQYLQTSKQEPIYLTMWNEALVGVRKHLMTYSAHSNLLVLGERPNGLDQPLFPKMDHLVCFMPGTIALAATGGLTLAEAKKSLAWGKTQEQQMDLARQLMKTCWGMYKYTATGLSPEIAHFKIHDPPIMMDDETLQSPEILSDDADAEWRKDYDIHINDRHNLQRPETVESLFYMWRITGDVKYREWGWHMFESFMLHTKVPEGSGFTSIQDVDQIPPPVRDNMESFWLAETLKYFYLLFGPDDILPLHQIVLNTEAHPFPRFELGRLFSTGWQRKPRDSEGSIITEKVPPELAQSETQTVQVKTITNAT